MDAQQLKDFYAVDPGNHIKAADKTGTLEQQINFAALSYSWISQLDYGYVADEEEVCALIESRVRARGVIE